MMGRYALQKGFREMLVINAAGVASLEDSRECR